MGRRVRECIPCMGVDIKGAIRESIRDISVDLSLDKIPDCPNPLEIDFCAKPERKKSAYQQFVSECMKTKPIKGKPFGEAAKYMKECAVAWKQHKNESKD